MHLLMSGLHSGVEFVNNSIIKTSIWDYLNISNINLLLLYA